MAYTAREQPFSAAAVRWSLAFAVTCTAGSKRATAYGISVRRCSRLGLHFEAADFQEVVCGLTGHTLRMRIMRDFAVVATACCTCCLGASVYSLQSRSIQMRDALIREGTVKSECPIAMHKTITASYEPDGMTYVLHEAHTTKAALNTFFLWFYKWPSSIAMVQAIGDLLTHSFQILSLSKRSWTALYSSK